jgi:hypothetical protein
MLSLSLRRAVIKEAAINILHRFFLTRSKAVLTVAASLTSAVGAESLLEQSGSSNATSSLADLLCHSIGILREGAGSDGASARHLQGRDERAPPELIFTRERRADASVLGAVTHESRWGTTASLGTQLMRFTTARMTVEWPRGDLSRVSWRLWERARLLRSVRGPGAVRRAIQCISRCGMTT